MLIGARAFIDGSVLADASAGSSSSGGGSGGSILIQTAELEGFGTVTANGGESWVLRWLAAVSPSCSPFIFHRWNFYMKEVLKGCLSVIIYDNYACPLANFVLINVCHERSA
jgi:hypothetical protein